MGTQELDPVLLERLRDMRQQWGLDSLLRLDRMFAKQRTRLDEMRRAVVEGDAETVVEIAHYLKGTARSLGAERLTELFETQERRARDGDVGNSESLQESLREEWHRVGEAFRIVTESDDTSAG